MVYLHTKENGGRILVIAIINKEGNKLVTVIKYEVLQYH